MELNPIERWALDFVNGQKKLAALAIEASARIETCEHCGSDVLIDTDRVFDLIEQFGMSDDKTISTREFAVMLMYKRSTRGQFLNKCRCQE